MTTGAGREKARRIALQDEFEYYLAHQDEMVEQYNGKVVVLKGDTVLGVYDDEIEAIDETIKTYELGTFMVHRVTPGDAGHTQTFHSRVVFS